MDAFICDMYLEIVTCMIGFVSYYETPILPVQDIYPDFAVLIRRLSRYVHFKYPFGRFAEPVKRF
jgi:hypothetical protein